MKPIKKISSVSARKISIRVNTLSRLNLCNLTKEDVVNSLLNSFNLPYNQFPQKAKIGYIFRACINESEDPFSSLKRIAYNPKPDYIGRANLTGKGIGYGASSLDTAAIESCQNSLRSSNQSSFYLTIGIWVVNKDLSTVLICHSKKALSTGTDLIIAFKALIEKKIREDHFSKKQLRIWSLKNRFISDQFAKSKIKCENDYYYSAIFTNTAFKSQAPVIDCIWYPSQAYMYKGFNIAYKPDLVEKRILTPVYVTNVKIEFLRNRRKYPKITILGTTGKFDGDKIIW